MAPTTCVFIGGKQIGVNCFRLLLEQKVIPALVIANLDDAGEDTWHESLVKIAASANAEVIGNKKVRDPEVVALLKKISPEIIFCIGGMQIIPKEVLDIPRLGTLNLHPALLPKYRGRFSTAHAIFNGEKTHGVTAHWMDEGIDTGPVIMQEQFVIDDDDTAKIVYDKFTEVGSSLFKKFLDLWLSGDKIVATPQDESQATYYPKGLPCNGDVDWSWSGEQIRNWIRAMTFEPFPPASFHMGKKKMLIIDEKYFKGFDE